MGSHRGSDIQDQAQHRGQPLSNRLSNVVRTEVGSLFQKHVLNRKPWDTRKEPRLAIVTWIERTYHRRRRQGALGSCLRPKCHPNSGQTRCHSRGGVPRPESVQISGKRVVAAMLAVTGAYVGDWALVTPHSFSASLPLPGRHWISAPLRHDDQLTRAMGVLRPSAVLTLAAALLLGLLPLWPDRRLTSRREPQP